MIYKKRLKIKTSTRFLFFPEIVIVLSTIFREYDAENLVKHANFFFVTPADFICVS